MPWAVESRPCGAFFGFSDTLYKTSRPCGTHRPLTTGHWPLLNFAAHQATSAAAKDRFAGDEENDDRLQDHYPVFRNFIGEDIYEKLRRSEEHTSELQSP